MNIVNQSAFQYSCSNCLRLKYVGNLTDRMPDGTLLEHGWKPCYKRSGRKTTCSFCGDKFRYLFFRAHQDQQASRSGQ